MSTTAGAVDGGTVVAPGALARPVPLGVLAAAVLVIGVLDWITPAGVVVGALFTIPIILSFGLPAWTSVALPRASFTPSGIT